MPKDRRDSPDRLLDGGGGGAAGGGPGVDRGGAEIGRGVEDEAVADFEAAPGEDLHQFGRRLADGLVLGAAPAQLHLGGAGHVAAAAEGRRRRRQFARLGRAAHEH